MSQPVKKTSEQKRRMLFCEPCGYKLIVESDLDLAGLAEVKRSVVQSHIPALDPTTQKTVVKPAQTQPKMFKCPKCGRGTKMRDLLKPYVDLLKKADEEAERKRLEDDKKKRLEDGKPPEKKVDPEFMG